MEYSNLQERAMLNRLNSGQGVMHGRGEYIDPTTGEKYIPEFFTYRAEWNDIAGANYAAQRVIQIQADAEFIMYEMMAHFYDNTAPSTTVSDILLPNMNMLITDTGSGRNLFNSPVQINSIFGSAKRPFELRTPKRFAAAASIQLQLTAPVDMGVNAQTLQVVLVGEKRYYLD